MASHQACPIARRVAQVTTANAAQRPPRVLLVATHPIQYQVPLFQALASEAAIEFNVLYVQLPDAQQQGAGFGVAFKWDVPMLDGYRWQLASGVAGRGGLRGFFATRLRHPLVLLRGQRPDVLVLTGWHAWPLLQLLLAAWLLRVPVVMRGDSNALRARSLPARSYHRLVVRLCKAFLTVGKANAAFYNSYGVKEQRLFAVPHFVDNHRFSVTATALEPQRGASRQRWAIPPGAVCLLYAGKLEPKKRIVDLLDALRMARDSLAPGSPGLHLLVVGTGELMEEARAFASQHALPVTFAGFLNQTEMPAAYVAADCLVLPSDYGETWGLVVNEAMACGKPAVVSSRVGCGPDLITEGETGYTFPFGDVGALAQRLAYLASHRGELAAMGARARERVQEGYSVERAVTGTLAAVRYVTGRA